MLFYFMDQWCLQKLQNKNTCQFLGGYSNIILAKLYWEVVWASSKTLRKYYSSSKEVSWITERLRTLHTLTQVQYIDNIKHIPLVYS
jgi:hypothetical protein